jgi:hypothetical protein
MDPNTNLKELRSLVAGNVDKEFVSDHDTARMMELIGSLDEWLTRGGFLPTDWARNPS